MNFFQLANEGLFLDQNNRLLSQMREAKEAALTQAPEDDLSPDAMTVSFPQVEQVLFASQQLIRRTEATLQEDI